MPLSGLIVPDGGTGILMSSGLPGTSLDGKSGMWMRFALLLYDAGMISMISSRGNSRLGMSCAEHAIRYPYNTRSTDSCAMISKSFCSRSSSRMQGSRRTARSW